MVKYFFLIWLLSFQSFAEPSAEQLRKEEEIRRLNAPPETCGPAKTKLENYINSKSKSCKKTSDCAVMYLHATSCAPPFLLNKAYDGEKDKELLKLQKETREACKKEFSTYPACSPMAMFVACYKGQCVPKHTVPVTVPDKTAELKYRYGLISNSCAPNDGPAKLIVLTEKKITCAEKDKTFPIVYINWYGSIPQIPLTKQVSIKGVEGDMTLQSSICLENSSCKGAQSTQLEIQSLDVKAGQGSFILKLEDGRTVKSDFELEACEFEHQICG